MPILPVCTKCNRKGGYAKKESHMTCARCIGKKGRTEDNNKNNPEWKEGDEK